MTKSYAKEIARLVADVEKMGLDVRLSGNNRYIIQLPNGSTTSFNMNTDPSAMDQQRKRFIEAGLVWPLDPKPRVRKTRTTPTENIPTPTTAKLIKEVPVTQPAVPAMPDEVSIENITPEMAEQWLERNVSNRKLSGPTVTKYARQMTDGHWHFDAAPIRFNIRGELIDGQHRLWALIESETTQKFLVVRGIAVDAFVVMDIGKKRSFGDVLSIKYPGLTMLSALSATINVIYKWELGFRGTNLRSNGGSNQKRSIDNDNLLSFYETDREKLTAISRRSHNIGKQVPGLTGAAAAVALWVFDEIDAEDTEDFFDRLITGAGLDEGHPILTLRNTLLRYARDKDVREGMPIDMSLPLVIKAWNAYRKGEEIRVLRFRAGGASPEGWPEAI